MHALGDYVRTIEEYGTTDSYSTQIGELQNRKIKAQYARTNKRNAVEQMTRISDICAVLEDMDQALDRLLQQSSPQQIDEEAVESILDGSPYSIGRKDRSEDMIPGIARWVDAQREDDAIKLFIPQLKRHLLARILGSRDHPDFNDNELGRLQFHQGRMYRHRTLRINYTTYDVLRHQDVINPSTPHCFALLPAEFDQDSDAHPYIYAKVIGVYHTKAVYRGVPRRMDFVHVRWLYYDYERPGGWDSCQLDHLSYSKCLTDEDNVDAFDFVDPNDIIRASHLIPDFNSGTTSDLLRASRSVAHDNDGNDWQSYYVDRFVDRDMLMRYIGGGIGHFKQDIGRTAADTEERATNDLNEEPNHGDDGEGSESVDWDEDEDDEDEGEDMGEGEGIGEDEGTVWGGTQGQGEDRDGEGNGHGDGIVNSTPGAERLGVENDMDYEVDSDDGAYVDEEFEFYDY